MSKYIKVDDLQEYCNNMKDHSITPNEFQRMNHIEIPDEHGRIIDTGPLEELYDNLEADNGIYMEDAGETLQRILDAPTILEAST